VTYPRPFSSAAGVLHFVVNAPGVRLSALTYF
jgi:hypothetical protein